jgi:ABC-type glycerol-3-phosphate transport system substrate-binding protein
VSVGDANWLHRTIRVAAVVAVGWWLFADTIAHYAQPTATTTNVIRFAHFGSFEDYRLFQSIIESFEATHPDYRVKQEFIPGWYGRYESKLRQQILSETLPDVVVMQMAPFPRFREHFAGMDEWATRDERRALVDSLDATAVDAFDLRANDVGGIRAVPFAGGNLQIYINPDCFELASQHRRQKIVPPDEDWTMQQFRDLCTELTCDLDGDGITDQFGFWLPRWIYYLPFIWSHGADVVGSAEVAGAEVVGSVRSESVIANAGRTEWKLVGPSADEALSLYKSLASGPTRASPRPYEIPQIIQDVGFLTGKVAMCVNGPWFQPFLEKTRLRDRYIVAPIPSGSGGRATRVTWDGLCVSNQSPDARRRIAWQFVEHCLSREIQEQIAGTGRSLPALTAALHAFDDDERDPRRKHFVDALRDSRLQPRFDRFFPIDRAINNHLRRWIEDDDTRSASEFAHDLANDPAILREFSRTNEN